MAKVKWTPGIDVVSGLLGSRPKAGDPHSSQVGEYKRSTVPQAKELAARARFASVSAAVKARSKDLMQQATDITNFLAQKDAPNGKKTMKAYLWKVCGDAYDAALAGA